MATGTMGKKTSRIDLRMTGEQKRAIEQAAASTGLSVSQWSLDRLVSSAHQTINPARMFSMSSAAFDELARQLDGDPTPRFTKFMAGRTMWED